MDDNKTLWSNGKREMWPKMDNDQKPRPNDNREMWPKVDNNQNLRSNDNQKRPSMDDKQRLMRQIQMMSFAAFEAGLYLDTHNTDREALAYYAKQRDKAKELEDQYVKKYGPLFMSESNSNRVWEWSKGPWPWEYAAN